MARNKFGKPKYDKSGKMDKNQLSWNFASDPHSCPFCGNSNLKTPEVEFINCSTEFEIKMSCEKCDKEWKVHCKMCRTEEIE